MIVGWDQSCAVCWYEEMITHITAYSSLFKMLHFYSFRWGEYFGFSLVILYDLNMKYGIITISPNMGQFFEKHC